MSDKKEPIRHIDKTRQDHMPAAQRPRVHQWQARKDAMRSTDPFTPSQRARIDAGETFCPAGEHYAADIRCDHYHDKESV